MSTGPADYGADEFARRRVKRQDRNRKRYAVIAVVVVLVGALAVGALVAYAFGGGDDDAPPPRDDAGRLVPPDGLGLDADSAERLVADGVWPSGGEVEGMPDGDAARIGWLLTEVAWDAEQTAVLGDGLAAATQDDPELAAALTEGIAGASMPLVDRLQVPVAEALARWSEPAAVVLAGEKPGAEDPAFAEADLVATFGAVGLGAGRALEQPLVARMTQGWAVVLPPQARDRPQGARRFTAEYPEQFRRLVRPVVVLYASLAGQDCVADEECRQELVARTARPDQDLAALVLDSIPRTLLPRAVDDALGEDDSVHRTLPPDALPAWNRFREQQGYGVTGPVLDALGG